MLSGSICQLLSPISRQPRSAAAAAASSRLGGQLASVNASYEIWYSSSAASASDINNSWGVDRADVRGGSAERKMHTHVVYVWVGGRLHNKQKRHHNTDGRRERERERELERKKKIELAADIFAKHSGLSTTRFLNANAPEHCASDKKVHLAPTKGSEL
jgi:hypothetical protein